jgi:peptidoglycan/LPS O-acetylase OafA/YrhL
MDAGLCVFLQQLPRTIAVMSDGIRAAERGYMPQLDSLRFFAVLGVMITHNGQPQQFPWIFGTLPWGSLGVRLFFVLSGFLITGILLDCRDLADATSHNPLFLIRQFYIRRFLRIFPIYYFVLAVVFAVNLSPAREIWIWLVTYTSNIYISLYGRWIGNLGHFWTLAVEEQFYIFWPWLVLFAPKKWLIPILSFALVLAPLYRFLAVTIFPADFATGEWTKATFTFSCLDSLAAGALVAVISQSTARKQIISKFFSNLLLPVGAISFILVSILYHYKTYPIAFYVFGDFFSTMVFCWLVSSASRGFNGIVGWLLEFNLLIYFGKITYGIYIYHNFVPALLSPILKQFGTEYSKRSLLHFILSVVVTLLIASLSWHLIEQPINNLKRYFKYTPSHTIDTSIIYSSQRNQQALR